MIKYISEVPNAPKAVGPYSPATVYNGMAYLSGQVALDPETGKLIAGDTQAQVEQVMNNISAVLTHLDLDFSKVVKTTIFLTDLADFQLVNKIYAEKMQGARPARTTVQVAALPLGAKVEIEMIAAQSGLNNPL